MTEGQKNFGKAWRERMSALRNLPPVLAIVWRSRPLVVALGLVFRLIAAVQPLALLYVSKLIIDFGDESGFQAHRPLFREAQRNSMAGSFAGLIGNATNQ